MEKLKKLISTYENYPKTGVNFKDVLEIVHYPKIFKELIQKMSSSELIKNAEALISIDARGFVFGSAIALKTSKPMIVARKPGKLPGEIIKKKYKLEYGEHVLTIQKNAIKKFNSFSPYSRLYFFLIISPGNFPGFLATIIGFEVCKAIADPKTNPLASIEINASAFLINSLEDIFRINSLKISG